MDTPKKQNQDSMVDRLFPKLRELDGFGSDLYSTIMLSSRATAQIRVFDRNGKLVASPPLQET